MKKLVTIALLCAMLLSCFASCATMQAGELDVAAYADEAGAQNVEFRTELSDDADVWDGAASDRSWYDNDPTKTEYEISTAAQLRGLYAIQQACANKTSCFEGVTIKLTNDIDLNGKTWTSAASERYFAGTFDGQGHVISNWKQSVGGSGYQSFFGSITGNACIKNISLVNATFTNAASKDDKNNFGTLVTRVNTQNGKTATISNVYTEVDFVVKSGAKQFAAVGAIASYVTGDGNLVIENCQNNNTIAGNGKYNGGIISQLAKAKKVTINNCSMTGSINVILNGGSDASTGGIVGVVGTVSDTLNIQNCTVSGDVKADGYKVGGIIGYSGTCKNGLNISNCVVSGNIEATTMSAGILGYNDKAMTVTISGCRVTGSFKGHRASGGIVGTLNAGSKAATITDCTVTASLTFALDDVKNNNGGGLIGKLQTDVVFIDNCHVDSVMKATFAQGATAKETDDLNSGAAGLIGRVFDGDKVYISNSSVAGNYEFITEGNSFGLLFNVGSFVGSVGEGSSVIFRENNAVASNLIKKYTGNAADFAIDGVGNVPSILPVGYQTKDNGDGTYDLRYVIAAKDLYDGLGVRANIRFVDANGVFDEKNNNIYVDTVYSYVADDEGNLYAAEDYGYDYLYTLVVKGVPAEYAFDANNLQVILKPFGATKVGEGVVLTESGLIDQGKSLGNTSAANMNITLSNMSTTLDDKFVAEDAIYIDGHAFDTNVSYGVHTGVKASAAECTGGYADGTLEIPAHVYLDHAIVGGNDFQFMNITYNFKVTEAGWYDLSIYMRMKGNDLVKDSGDCDGSYKRGYLVMFDWAGGEQAYDLLMNFDKVADIKTDSAGTYLNGLKVYLEAGEHTITFKGDEGYINSFPHIRGIYLAKAD